MWVTHEYQNRPVQKHIARPTDRSPVVPISTDLPLILCLGATSDTFQSPYPDPCIGLSAFNRPPERINTTADFTMTSQWDALVPATSTFPRYDFSRFSIYLYIETASRVLCLDVHVSPQFESRPTPPKRSLPCGQEQLGAGQLRLDAHDFTFLDGM